MILHNLAQGIGLAWPAFAFPEPVVLTRAHPDPAPGVIAYL